VLVEQASSILQGHGEEADLLRAIARYFRRARPLMTQHGVYPGTFDPVTLGHLDIIRRGARLVDRLVIGSPPILPSSRCSRSPSGWRWSARGGGPTWRQHRGRGVRQPADGLRRAQGATMILRGLRAVADFEYEYQMAGMNQQLNDRIETVFLMADVSFSRSRQGW
jgi:pantetheine-phosphate adenylyltransferase